MKKTLTNARNFHYTKLLSSCSSSAGQRFFLCSSTSGKFVLGQSKAGTPVKYKSVLFSSLWVSEFSDFFIENSRFFSISVNRWQTGYTMPKSVTTSAPAMSSSSRLGQWDPISWRNMLLGMFLLRVNCVKHDPLTGKYILWMRGSSIPYLLLLSNWVPNPRGARANA